jgi:hypothetical protein
MVTDLCVSFVLGGLLAAGLFALTGCGSLGQGVGAWVAVAVYFARGQARCAWWRI